jgi:hypothetical protein
MIAYELHQARSAELRLRAERWRLVQDAKAARTARRRAARTQARRTQAHTAVRQDAEGVSSSDRSGVSPLGRIRRVPRPHSAA